jgi:hypothetical protein
MSANDPKRTFRQAFFSASGVAVSWMICVSSAARNDRLKRNEIFWLDRASA